MSEQIRVGDRVGWLDDEVLTRKGRHTFRVSTVVQVIPGYFLVEVGDRLWPIRVDEALPPF